MWPVWTVQHAFRPSWPHHSFCGWPTADFHLIVFETWFFYSLYNKQLILFLRCWFRFKEKLWYNQYKNIQCNCSVFNQSPDEPYTHRAAGHMIMMSLRCSVECLKLLFVSFCNMEASACSASSLFALWEEVSSSRFPTNPCILPPLPTILCGS